MQTVIARMAKQKLISGSTTPSDTYFMLIIEAMVRTWKVPSAVAKNVLSMLSTVDWNLFCTLEHYFLGHR